MKIPVSLKLFIPDITAATEEEYVELWYWGGVFTFYEVTSKNTPKPFYVCLLDVTDFVPEPFAGSFAIEGMEDSFGLRVKGCFFVGGGILDRPEDDAKQLPAELVSRTQLHLGGKLYYLYLLEQPIEIEA